MPPKRAAAPIGSRTAAAAKKQPAAAPVTQSVVPPSAHRNAPVKEEGAGMKAGFAALSTRFAGFHEELAQAREKDGAEQRKAIKELEGKMAVLAESMQLETKNRAQAISALQGWLTDRIEQWTAVIEAPMLSKLDALHKRIETVNDRISVLETRQEENKAALPKLVDQRCSELLAEIRDLKRVVEADRLAREEKEQRILIKVQEQGTKLTEALAAEKVVVDKRITELREELAEEVAARTRADDILRISIDESVADFPGQIAAEAKAREKADEELSSAIQHYTAALQDGMKILAANRG